jgi:UDP-N-acetylmuramoyl-L-alanyl-D-glutamate--2,6-diaminopimelate ligase
MKLSVLMQNIPVISYQNISFEAEITSITSKSQSVQKDSAFVCLKGTHVDGADFAQEALKNGALV